MDFLPTPYLIPQSSKGRNESRMLSFLPLLLMVLQLLCTAVSLIFGFAESEDNAEDRLKKD